MKKLIIAAAAIAFSAPAFAQVNDSIPIDAERAVECNLDSLPSSVNFNELGRRGQAEAVSANGLSVFCNRPSTVSVTSTNGFLKLSDVDNTTEDESDFLSPGNAGFAAGVDYSITIPSFAAYGSFSADTSALTANSPVVLNDVPALNDPNFRLVFDTIAGQLPLIGGDYSDTILITITPDAA